MELLEKDDLNQEQRKLLEAAGFLGRFLFAGLVFQLILFWRPDTVFIQRYLAELTAGMLQLAGREAYVSGISVYSSGTQFIVNQDCLGWKSMAAFLGLGFASKRTAVKYAAAGLAVIAGINIFRVFSTVYLSTYISFDLLHAVLWQGGMTASVLLLWIIWTKLEPRKSLLASVGRIR